MRKLKQLFRNVLTVTILLLSTGTLFAQFAINGVVADDQVQFANNPSFEIGNLTIKVKLPSSKTTAEVTVTLPTGIEYVVGSATPGANAASVTYQTSSPVSKPVFTMVGTTPNTEVTFTIKRKITKTATDALDGKLLTDKVKVAITGEGEEEKDSNSYRVTPPVVTVQGVTQVSNAPIGENTTTFGIRNTGVGATRTIFFSVAYPAGITHVSFTPPPGVTLDQVGTVPTGFENAGQPMYRLTKPTGFLGNELVTITQKYQIAASLCGKQPKIGYVPYWGLSATELFGQNTRVDRDIKVRTYTPIVKQTQDGNKRYFVEGAGLTATAGQKLGTFYTAFKNESTDATAYNNRLNNLYQILTNFKPDNFYIIATDGTKIPIPSTFTDNVNSTGFDFRNLPALADAALTGKDIGFTDEDGDGFRDDLKPGAEVRICFDLVATGTPFTCNPYILSINPSFYYHYESACGETIELRDNPNVYTRYFGRVNKTSFPAQLLKNAPEKGRIAPNMNSVGVFERFQGDASHRTNDIRYRYYMQLPSGIALKNVVFYYAREVGDTSVPSVAIGNIPAGGLLDFTTPETPPPGVSVSDARLWGYVSFDIELTDCTGLSNATSIDYKVFVMSRNQGGTTFTPIPILCESVNVALGCSVPCGVNGPEMLSTKVERADNSYGWTDATMTQRVQRANISAEQRRKVLHLDDIEFFAEGKQSPNATADNLFYYTAVEKRVNLDPKFIKVKIGAHEVTLQATDPGVVTRATNANGNYYRWNLTNALPSGILAAGQTFSVVATYQVNNPSNSSSSEEQSGKTSYFYTLADKNDPAVSPQGYHTNALRCGLDLIPVFTFANTTIAYGMNSFGVTACAPTYIGGNFIHFGRPQNNGSNLYTEEYRPGVLMRKIVLKIPLSYKIIDNPEYFYTANIADTKKHYSQQSSVTIPLANWVESTEGNNRVYTYLNPVNRTDPLHLPAGIVATTYSQWLRVKVQASCKSKEFTGTEAAKRAAAIAAGEIGTYVVECEDYYYHYADSPTPLVVEKTNFSVMNMASKPQLLLSARGQGSTIRANRSEQQTVFAIETRYNAAPNTWISIPDVTGVEVLGLEEVNDAAGTTVVRPLTPETNITGEKMFFLNQIIQVGAANQKYYRLKFKLTNCSNPQVKFKVYAGWNCEGNPTQGYRATCDDTFLEYTVNIAQSKKEIEVGGNPTSLAMCAKTPFSYIVKSTDEGDIFGANLVVTQQPGIVISDVKVEYPLNSGKVYDTSTPVDGKKIGVTTVGGKTTYQLFDILPGGSLPGSVSTNVENEQKFKVTFNVQPDCDFVAGSSFDIDLEGNNLCGVPAIGPKIVENVAGITGAAVNDYNMLLSSVDYISGNANACDSGATYKVRVSVNVTSSNPLFTVGNDARLHIRFPQSYDIQNSDITIDRSAFPQASPNSSWADPTVESRGVVGGENEIIMKVPAGMKDTHYFEVMVKIKQKANTAISCTDERFLKVLTTDKITNIFCSTLGGNCPALIVSTSPEKKSKIENKRASLSLADVKVSSTVQGNKEKLTVKYKVTNADTAEALYNGSLKVSLYHDVNGNGLVDAGDTLLKDNTQNENIAIGATSPERSFTYVADQSEVCRLLLAIKDNYCLCDNVVSLATPPTELTGLISDATICESESKVLNYVAAPAPVYQAYTWEAVSPANALDYLSATNTALPTFHYTGAKLTTTTEFKYKLKVKRTNGCESSQEVKLTVKPAPDKPTLTLTAESCNSPTIVKVTNHATGKTYTFIKSSDNSTVTGASVDNGTGEITSLAVGKYKVKATQGGCTSELSDEFEIKAQKDVPAKPIIVLIPESCTSRTIAKIANYDSNQTYWLNGTTQLTSLTLTGEIQNLQTGSYTITAKNATCESAPSDSFRIKAQKTPPAVPTVSEHTAATCSAISVAKLNYTNRVTYIFVKSADNSTVSRVNVATDGKITGLDVGKYKVKASKNGCESALSDEFEIEGFKAKPDQPKVSTEAQCDNPSKAEITNVKPDTEVTAYTFKNVETSAIVTATVDRTTGEVSALPVGKYKVTATNSDGCTQESDLFEIKAAKGHPDKPVLSTTESCNTLSLAKIENYQSSQSYTFVKADGTPLTGITVATNGVVNNLTIGTYQVKTTREGCDSDLSDPFEIKPKKAATAITTQPEGHNYAKNAIADEITVVATGEGNLRYKWFKNTTNSRTGADVTEITTATTASYIPATDTVGSLFYWVEVTGDCGTLKSDIVEIKVTETIAAIEANDDTATVRRGQSVPVLPNDYVGGNPATLTNVTIAIHNNDGLTGATIDPQGRIKVPTNATPGTYNVVYKICLVSDPNTCKNATAKITVTNDPAYTIEANDDPLTRVAKGGTVNVLSNDQVNGNPATPTVVDVTIEDNGGLANLEVNTATGKLKVPAGATPGTYEVTYRICIKGETSPCDTAKVKIEVTSNAAPTTTINANDDPNTSVAKGGSVEVLSNDRLNGEPVTKDKVTTTIDNDGGLTGVEIDPATGKIKVPVTATEGTYEVTYKICEKQNGTPCDTAMVKITVTSDVIHTIEANDDPEVTVGKGGTVTVLNNDTVDGNPATKDNVDISIDNNGGLTDLTTDPDGKIKVPANATPNTYEVTYRICVKGASSPCATAKVKITVTNDTSTTIIANDDPLTYVAKGGTADVLSNDRLGGDPATKDNVIVTIDSDGGLTGVDIDTATGKIKVPATATEGIYEVTYKICERQNGTPCDTAKIKIKVTENTAPTPTINANNDPDTRVRPGDKVEVLSNDRLNGAPATKDNVKVSIDNDGGLPGVTIDEATGKIQIPTDAPARTYEITYKICEKQNGTPCATAKVKVSVDNDTIRTIEANNDPLTRVAKGDTVDILSNDKVDGRPADKDKVNVSIENSGRLAGVTIEPTTGKIKVPTDAAPGTYEVTYKICHKQQADLCDTATVTIEVVDVPAGTPTITANDDPLTRVPKGGTVDVLSNDRVNRDPATKDNVVPSIDNDGGLPGVTIDSNTGKIQIPTSATPGTYEVTYKICERQNGTPCTTAKVKIEVTNDTTPASTIIANDDPDTRVRPGGTIEVLSNDRLNGAPIQTGEVTITIVNKGGLEGLTLTPAGKLKVPDDATPGNSYEVTYEICQASTGTPCATAKVKITIGTARAIEAKNDNFGSIPNTADYTSTHTVFSAGVDTLEGVSGVLVPGTDVILHPGTAPHADISMDPATGKISIKAGTPVGDYEYQYTICEKAEPTNCSNTATVRFKVVDKTIVANNDGLWIVGTKGGLTPSVLNNDMLNGRTGLSEADVVIEATQGEHNDVDHFRMNVDGRISVIPGLPVGAYTYHYTIKEKGNEGNIDKAQVRIKIVSFAAADDEFTEINNQDQPKTIEQSVLKNDELDGRTPLTTAEVDITPGVFKDNNNNPVDYFTFDTTTGKITIKPHTPNGTYSFSYTICKKGTRQCADPAQVTIKLETVEAVDDDYSATPVNTVAGAKIIGNVLDNDRYQGGPAIDHKDKGIVSKVGGNDGDRVQIDREGQVIVPQGMPAGTYTIEYELCVENTNSCDRATVTIVVFEDKPLVIHNGISADGDGHNDYFHIESIERYPVNNLKIFNRWGVLVYEKDGYRNDTEPFDGHSNGRATINASSKLPQGTYYYILEYKDSVGQTQKNQGWLYLKY